jgi:hypothetical protein
MKRVYLGAALLDKWRSNRMSYTPEVRETNNGATIFGILAVVVIVALIVFFAWHPWTTTPTSTTYNTSTTVVQPTAAPPAGTQSAIHIAYQVARGSPPNRLRPVVPGNMDVGYLAQTSRGDRTNG